MTVQYLGWIQHRINDATSALLNWLYSALVVQLGWKGRKIWNKELHLQPPEFIDAMVVSVATSIKFAP